MLVMMMLPMSVMASSYEKVKVLKSGKWAKKSEWEDKEMVCHYIFYKITVKKSGRLKFKTTKEGDAYLFENLTDCKNHILYGAHNYCHIQNNSIISIDKGTYYLFVNHGKSKYTFTAVKAPTNYCPAKARKLKANQWVNNCFTPKTNYRRWYKIINPREKRINIWRQEGGVIVLNSKFQVMSTMAYVPEVYSKGCQKFCTRDILPKGTYYILDSGYSYHEDEYDFDSTSWTGASNMFKWN